MSIESTLDYIHHVKWVGAKPGLERTRELLAALGNPEKSLKFIHIAGTNGKGSTAAMISSVLKSAGYKTGLYTSPFIVRFNERMQINGECISDEELELTTDLVRPFADAMIDSPTEFEMITALAMLYFQRNECDVVVLEVGMGGELDSTNVIDTPELAIITAMGLDHTAELGETLAEIASAKAGIIKPGGTVAVYGAEPEALTVFEETCRAKNATLVRTDFSKLLIHSLTFEGSSLDFGEQHDLFVPLSGTFQPKNCALAVTALLVLRDKGYAITDEHIKTGLADTHWPGRFEVLRRDPLIIADGAHNPHAIEVAVQSVKALLGGIKPVFVLGVMADKDVEHMTEALIPLAKGFIAVTPSNPRALKADRLAELLRTEAAVAANSANTDSAPMVEPLIIEAATSISDGIARATALAGTDGAVVALGSLYFAADVRSAVSAL